VLVLLLENNTISWLPVPVILGISSLLELLLPTARLMVTYAESTPYDLQAELDDLQVLAHAGLTFSLFLIASPDNSLWSDVGPGLFWANLLHFLLCLW